VARVVPASVPAFKTYSVRSGDTVGTIASKFGMSIVQLKAINHLRSNRLVVGQALKISVQAQTSAGKGQTSSSKGASSQFHNVKAGDNLWSIARRYGSSHQQLQRLNGGKLRLLRPGQRLRIR
jgi:LysM repeat protein